MVRDGFLRDEEVHRMAIPTVGRTRAEFAAPFESEGYFAGLSIEQMEVFDAEDSIWTTYLDTADARLLGGRWAAFSRASVFPTLAAGLEGGREDARYPLFLDRLEADVAARLASSPAPMRIPLARMLFAKQG
ncbi:hypothetical protein [Blastopirellula marina]|uniref:SAM-dependent methyltransferase n=1 Tax=Blastopirellula marina TaxID=124 RepID=A0A2S8F7K7_9BACT|nr:hypothetical protein [Blastopirellula marina]PQO28135.1 hypothetical protein C5Y98_24840 [Blastopirellula marina]PTL41675.1 hypothetical protein C5Y97_24855 [Blastopirellula marina]